jgi:hypothetical protein
VAGLEPSGGVWRYERRRLAMPGLHYGWRQGNVRRTHCGFSPLKRADIMRKPPRRLDIPPRNKDNNKRRLWRDIPPSVVGELLETVTYKGSPKHKRNPRIFDLEPFIGDRGDATLCDDHANFQPADMAEIPRLIERGLKAGLIGTNLWTVSDSGWIFEGRLTNAIRSEYHGYPVRPAEAIAEPVYRRFRAWAAAAGDAADKRAAENCAALYRFR